MALNGPTDGMFDSTSVMLSKMMEMTVERQRVISNNIANVSTPGFKRRYLSFEDEFNRMVQSGKWDELQQLEPSVGEDKDTPGRLDGNNVSLPNETNDLLRNGMYHRLLNRALKLKMKILRSAISGGR